MEPEPFAPIPQGVAGGGDAEQYPGLGLSLVEQPQQQEADDQPEGATERQVDCPCRRDELAQNPPPGNRCPQAQSVPHREA